jgi:hypothetical protein
MPRSSRCRCSDLTAQPGNCLGQSLAARSAVEKWRLGSRGAARAAGELHVALRLSGRTSPGRCPGRFRPLGFHRTYRGPSVPNHALEVAPDADQGGASHAIGATADGQQRRVGTRRGRQIFQKKAAPDPLALAQGGRGSIKPSHRSPQAWNEHHL